MPVAHFHLPRNTFSADEERRLALAASETYARVLDSPIDRVRVFVVHYEPTAVAVGGRLVDEGAAVSPYFTAIVLAGRTVEQRQELASALTDVVVDVLGVERKQVRGQIVEVAPENWSIGGTPASALRAAEIAARR
ncbi:tautomerase family protein [Gordonia sp. Z-3]|jgi:4-oxalocrotonate tautomerase family enzyme|uniref:Tautomerase family protein n=1 Tax=Gordonia aquimaris TaxID=2984863 RepID=A0A9X3D7V3_9ACTN|nr:MULTISPECIES: tautomerase family protein [Gordonia]MCX2966332.1 tautomerase family protein [Gordonia aquimaris]MDY6811636.1 tautomerase family protein [Actinomycetota bacterium]MED5801197.1 tautomerase family protein [Gordonia sp. Z-3]